MRKKNDFCAMLISLESTLREWITQCGKLECHTTIITMFLPPWLSHVTDVSRCHDFFAFMMDQTVNFNRIFISPRQTKRNFRFPTNREKCPQNIFPTPSTCSLKLLFNYLIKKQHSILLARATYSRFLRRSISTLDEQKQK